MFAAAAGADWEQRCVQREKRAIHLPDRYGSSVEDEVEFSGRLSCCQQHLCNIQTELEQLVFTYLTQALVCLSDGCAHL